MLNFNLISWIENFNYHQIQTTYFSINYFKFSIKVNYPLKFLIKTYYQYAKLDRYIMKSVSFTIEGKENWKIMWVFVIHDWWLMYMVDDWCTWIFMFNTQLLIWSWFRNSDFAHFAWSSTVRRVWYQETTWWYICMQRVKLCLRGIN